jgi:hypothetical protein
MKQKYHTVAMRRQTYERLKDYKMGGGTYDQVLNELMDALPLEEVSKEFLAEHRRRMKDLRGTDWREVRKSLGDD